MQGMNIVAQIVFSLVPLVLSLTVHEWAHAWSARKLGDDTAEREGRLTLNPAAHIDPIGTLLLPIIGVLSGGIVSFGWAKPVPVNPTRFRRDVNMSTGMALTAAAGPISNLILATLCAVGLGLMLRFNPQLRGQENAAVMLLVSGVQMNIGLAIFNMLPLPPLDGSRIVERFIPYSQRNNWESVKRIGPFLLMVTLVSGARFLSGPINAATGAMYSLISHIAG